jgi:hypothetical protein
LAFPAWAADYPSSKTGLAYGGDTVSIVSTEPHRATVTYENSHTQNSETGTYTVQAGDIIVDVEININRGPNDEEEAIVRPRGDYMAIPPEGYAIDGGSVTFQIVLPMF